MRHCMRLMLPCLLSACAAAETAAAIINGPLLLDVGTDHAAMVWESDNAGPGRVEYWTGDDEAAALSAASNVRTLDRHVSRDRDGGPAAFHIHKVSLKSLKPGTTYRYRVVAGDARSKTFAFATAELKPARIAFAVYGDSRTHSDVHAALVKAMSRFPIQFVINTGDLVDFGGNYDQWGEQFFAPLKGLGERVPVYTTKGNHDEGGDGYYEMYCLPDGGKGCYAFTRGDAEFVCLDTYDGATDAFAWAQRKMEQSKARWKVLLHHEPCLNVGSPHFSMWAYPKGLAAWDRLGVDLVLAGHAHMYERFRPLLATADARRVTTYVTSGGGGAHLYWPTDNPLLAKAAKVHHVCIVTIEGDTLSMKVIDAQGKELDSFSVTKRDGAMDAAYLKTGVRLQRAHLEQAMRAAFRTTMEPAADSALHVRVRADDTFAVGEPVTMVFSLDKEGAQRFALGGATTATAAPGKETDVRLTLTPRGTLKSMPYPTLRDLKAGLQVTCKGKDWTFTLPCLPPPIEISLE